MIKLLCLPPPVELENSVISCPRGILAPQGVGVGFGSMSLIHAEKIRTCPKNKLFKQHESDYQI